MQRGKQTVGQAWVSVFPKHPGSVPREGLLSSLRVLKLYFQDIFASQGKRIKPILLNSLFAFFSF